MTTDTTPWYPASWLDADGKPLPDVHEVEWGQWPPCEPHDTVEVLYEPDRKMKWKPTEQVAAGYVEWAYHMVVAIRIIERDEA